MTGAYSLLIAWINKERCTRGHRRVKACCRRPEKLLGVSRGKIRTSASLPFVQTRSLLRDRLSDRTMKALRPPARMPCEALPNG